MNNQFIFELNNLIKDRKDLRPDGAYTTSLFNSGLDRILRKVGEETGEVIIAAKNNDANELIDETSDLLFHLIVMLHNQGLNINDVIDRLESRHDKK